ncbi:hypothetical protein QN277_018868 [Acacia crassicarpa]|uniref:AAA+ ATPase domain-containing protein n=1 Tax=Acacia crassicarpa TaxID=499986 RepID=A0AAE1JWU3_9FABA|nr:hypothetical protein QN277_018868 [Acacia crassicarpa]
MAEVGVSVAAKLAEYLVDPTLRQLQYLFCVSKITRNVEIKKEELILKQGRVQERVQEAINKSERIDDAVNKWKSYVKSLIAELENLEEELKANNGCLGGWCPTWRRYRLCKKLVKTTKRMIDLNTKSDCFNPFSHPVIIPDIEYHSSQNFKLFSATQMAFDQLVEALKDDSSFLIGLSGMGGSGKTTLAKEVGKEAKKLQLFDRVVLATISQNPDIRKIQGEIADTLGIELKQESEIGRAKRIALRLQSGERILIILDDVWAKLNLEDIGIPFGGNHQRSCKVVLTTRRLDVCTLMECQKMIKLDLLKEDEAWTLFQTHANVGDVAKEDVARAIAMECKGLPIAIVAVGTCLKGKGIHEMKEMLYRLNNAKPINVDKGVRSAFACLELSYDYLQTDKAKKLLLMCAMFPEDHNIDVEDLFRYGMGLGLCRDIDSFETARSEVRTTINYLIDSSLLMDNSSKSNVHAQKYVKLHDMVRDVALWIASKEHRTIKVNCTEELDKLIIDGAVNDCYAFSSWYNNNRLLQFPSQFHAPKLEFLLLCSSKLLDLSHATFEGTEVLKALIILYTTSWRSKIELQPQSIQHLSNLRTLRLHCWNLHDISFVVSLTRLEILDLRGSKFARMPNGIEKLSKLKLLDLSKCTIDECCYKVIGRCSQLEELYVSILCSHSKNEDCYEYLVGLTALIKLRRYKLEIGEHDQGLVFHNEGTRYLCLTQLNTSMLGAIIKDLAQRATGIRFYKLKGGNNNFMMANIVQAIGSMNELTKLCLQKCSEIEYITDETTPHEDAIVHRLDELVLYDMDNLKQIHRGPSSFSLFQKLERLSISDCSQLLNIFPANCNLGNLKFLSICNCPMLTSLFPISATCTLLSLEELRIGVCNELKHVLDGEVGDDTWENSRFPKLKILSVFGCHKLESVCTTFLSLRFVQLQRLSIRNAPQMKFVFAGEQLMHDQDENQILLPLLEYLELEDLPSLVRICSERDHSCCPSIKTIEWRDCPNMELQEFNGHQLRNEEDKSLTAVESIRLDNCGVESIFHYQTGLKEQISTFQYLKELILEKCARLKFVFSTHICQNLPELSSVTISCCEELKAIFLGNEETQKNLPIVESFLLKLKRLQISKCNKLKFVLSFMISTTTSMLPQLSTLNISDCFEMEEVFKFSNTEHYDIDIDSDREITLPNMKSVELDNLPRFFNICQGFKFRTGELGRVEIHDCPKLMPIKGATIDWTKEIPLREYELKYNQLNNKEALNLPLSVLNVGGLDIQSPRVEDHHWRIIGDDEQEETDNSEILRLEQQMVGGVVPTQLLSFQYLYSLQVIGTKKFKFLFSMSTIVQNSLPKLTSLTLSDCEELEVIFGHSGDDDANYGDIIVLSSLKEIELRNLPNFKSVCLVGLQIQVELTDIDICNCSNFVVSSLGSALQQLGTLSVSTEDSNVETSSNVNEEKGKVLISRAVRLWLKDSMNLISVWEGRTFIKFENLALLHVTKCRRLKCIFPSTVMRSLPCLWYLRIEECEELEEIMSSGEEEHNHFPNESSNNSFCFPQLKSLIVERCRTLKWLFPSLPSTQRLPMLFQLEIEECSELKGLCNSEVEIHEEGFYNNSLPNLMRLTVEDCLVFSKTTLAALQSCKRRNIRYY